LESAEAQSAKAEARSAKADGPRNAPYHVSRRNTRLRRYCALRLWRLTSRRWECSPRSHSSCAARMKALRGATEDVRAVAAPMRITTA
jgi:hypothetical protein